MKMFQENNNPMSISLSNKYQVLYWQLLRKSRNQLRQIWFNHHEYHNSEQNQHRKLVKPAIKHMAMLVTVIFKSGDKFSAVIVVDD